ncbi:MAG: hypothetical protein ACKVT2_10365 [Saprospiraceae bacterium]
MSNLFSPLLNLSCLSDGTRPHQGRFGRAFALLGCLRVQVLGVRALDADGFRQKDNSGLDWDLYLAQTSTRGTRT